MKALHIIFTCIKIKNIIYIVLATIFFSCSSDDNCDEERAAINEEFDGYIEQVMNNPGPNGIDYDQISAFNQERELRLEEACN